MPELKKSLNDWTLEEVKENCKKTDYNCKNCPFLTEKLEWSCMLHSYPCDWDLSEKPRLTESELAICKAVGAKWVSRDNNSFLFVTLWPKKPEMSSDGKYLGHFIGDIGVELFPSVDCGDCICVDNVQPYKELNL